MGGRAPGRAQLLFNLAAGNPAESAANLVGLQRHLEAQRFQFDVHLVENCPEARAVASKAAASGARLLITAGGDGTVETVVPALLGRPVSVGIIPLGKRNNLARSLDIPV